MLSTIADYTRLTKDMGKSLTQVAAQPDVSRDTDYFLSHIGNVKTIDDFLKDYRLYSYAMKAFGLSDMTYAKAFMRKVLTEGVSDSKSFANKLTDTRYRQFAAAFNFAALGDKATQTAAATTGTATQYVTQTMEEKAGDQNEGLRLALYFTRKASTISTSYQILADKALTQVVQTAMGWPAIRTSAGLVELSVWAWVASHIAAKRCTNLVTLAGSWKSARSILSVIILAWTSMSDELMVAGQPMAVCTTCVIALSARIW